MLANQYKIASKWDVLSSYANKLPEFQISQIRIPIWWLSRNRTSKNRFWPEYLELEMKLLFRFWWGFQKSEPKIGIPNLGWEYHTLSVRVSYSQRALTVSLWEYHTLSVQRWDFHPTLRVWYSQRMLRVWWYSQRMLILSVCTSACAASNILSAPHAEAHAESISMRWEYHTLSIILSACAESITHAESIILSAADSGGYKKTIIGNCQYYRLTTLVNSTSTTLPNGLLPKGAKFCHTSNILLVGCQRRCALSRLYFNSSAAG